MDEGFFQGCWACQEQLLGTKETVEMNNFEIGRFLDKAKILLSSWQFELRKTVAKDDISAL